MLGGPRVVVYQLTGTAKGASITYVDSSGNIQQQTSISVPMTGEGGGPPGMTIRAEAGAFVSISAQNLGDSGTLDCSISADGAVVNTGHASGPYAIASCSAVVP